MANFAILRTEKLKTIQDVAGSGSHVFRLRDTPNADPARKSENKILVGGESNLLHQVVQNRIETGGTKARVRKDSVRAIEFMLTASPEWFEKASPQKLKQWQDANVEWLKGRYGEANVVSAVLHMDETTPHIHAHVVPITKDGRLSAKEFIGGTKHRLQELQTDYAKAMKGFGLERGSEKSIAKHQDVKTYYKYVNDAKNEKAKVPLIDKPPFFNRDEYQKRMKKRVSNLAKSAKYWKYECKRLSKTDNSKAVEEAEKKAKELEERKKKLETQLAEILNKKLAVDEEYSRYKQEKNKEVQGLTEQNERFKEKNKLLRRENEKLKKSKTFKIKPT